jgi:hypothetical protein
MAVDLKRGNACEPQEDDDRKNFLDYVKAFYETAVEIKLTDISMGKKR